MTIHLDRALEAVAALLPGTIDPAVEAKPAGSRGTTACGKNHKKNHSQTKAGDAKSCPADPDLRYA